MASYMNHFNLLQTISLLYWLITVTCNQSSLSHDEECSALFHFKQSIIHQEDDFCDASWFQTFHSWKPTSNASDARFDCCSWYGVECSNDHGQVIGLDLSECSLCGHINSSSTLFSLVHLQSLNLAMNYFDESEIPSEIASLTKLKSLNLSDSGFGGQIPNEISRLVQLSSLDLSRNPLMLRSPGGLNNLLQNLTILEELHLSEVDISSSIPHFLANFSSLRSIKLRNCSLQNEFPVAILELPKLKILNLAYNTNLSGSLPEFRNNSLLEHVDLVSTGYFGIVPESVSNLNRLKFLSLSGCSFSGSLPRSLSNLTQLAYLGLSANEFTGLFPSLISLSKLNVLWLCRNKFEKGPLPNWLGNLTRLDKLCLSKMNLNGEIPPSFFNLTQLTYLDLTWNQLQGPISRSFSNFKFLQLPNWLGNLTRLDKLCLSKMNLNGEIPPSFFNLTQLTYLDLTWNQLQGPISRSFSNFKFLQLPNWLGNLTRLDKLCLSKMNLNGEIPPSFFNLTQLTYLDLTWNQLQGPISRSFSNFKFLQYLSLFFNNFSGSVDLDMFLGLNKLKTLALGDNLISLMARNNYTNSTLPQLEVLDLQSCNLRKFPDFLFFQNEVISLFLHHNKIYGLVPVWIWNNSQETLQVIDLSYNSITGFHQHPHFLTWGRLQGFSIANNHVRGQLPIPPQTTISYDFSNNNLTGEIPSLICEVKSLRLLDLSCNNMNGTLPSCFGSLSNSLFALNLRLNNFHGIMMDAFTHGSLLESIDLSENEFSGHLPRSLTNCTNLEVLSLGDNSFSDVFPFWLGTLANLQVLVLRANNLYGPIQGSKTVWSQFPKLRIIDLSNNGFSGQLHRQYFQTWNAMKSAYVGESSVMDSEVFFGPFTRKLSYSMTLIHKGVRTEYQQILTIYMAIDLSCNDFEGEIPLSLQDLKGLQSLNLSNNHFTGRILPSLGSLKNLESLDLSRNELSGEISQQLVQLGFLSIFNVSFNHLDGPIPQGKQFDTFDNNSYMVNPELCGQPLSKECQDSKYASLPPASNMFKSESLLPSGRIDWIVIFCGVASGLVVGIVIGNFLHTRYSDRFRKRKDTQIRPNRNMRRN